MKLSGGVDNCAGIEIQFKSEKDVGPKVKSERACY